MIKHVWKYIFYPAREGGRYLDNYKIKMEEYISATDLVRNLSDYIDLAQEKKRLVILRKNKPEVVMLSVEEYNRIICNQKEVGEE